MKYRSKFVVISLLFLCILSISWILLNIINKDSFIQNFPIYDEAEEVQVNYITKNHPWLQQEILFRTSTSPEKVLEYYHRIFTAKGWKLVEDRDGIKIFISEGCPFASAEIVMNDSNGKTAVKILLYQQPCQ
jgi:hypothetical protein